MQKSFSGFQTRPVISKSQHERTDESSHLTKYQIFRIDLSQAQKNIYFVDLLQIDLNHLKILKMQVSLSVFKFQGSINDFFRKYINIVQVYKY